MAQFQTSQFPGTQHVMFAVHPDDVPFVIGGGGRTIKSVKRKSGAYIQIQQAQPEAGRPLPWFDVIGSEGQCKRAVGILSGIAKESERRRTSGDFSPKPHHQSKPRHRGPGKHHRHQQHQPKGKYQHKTKRHGGPGKQQQQAMYGGPGKQQQQAMYGGTATATDTSKTTTTVQLKASVAVPISKQVHPKRRLLVVDDMSATVEDKDTPKSPAYSAKSPSYSPYSPSFAPDTFVIGEGKDDVVVESSDGEVQGSAAM